MSELTELSRFQARSPLASEDEDARTDALRALIRNLEPSRPVRQRVSDMLSVVLALSARTRRMVLPRVNIDMDVFGPNGKRAVQVYLPEAE